MPTQAWVTTRSFVSLIASAGTAGESSVWGWESCDMDYCKSHSPITGTSIVHSRSLTPTSMYASTCSTTSNSDQKQRHASRLIAVADPESIRAEEEPNDSSDSVASNPSTIASEMPLEHDDLEIPLAGDQKRSPLYDEEDAPRIVQQPAVIPTFPTTHSALISAMKQTCFARVSSPLLDDRPYNTEPYDRLHSRPYSSSSHHFTQSYHTGNRSEIAMSYSQGRPL